LSKTADTKAVKEGELNSSIVLLKLEELLQKRGRVWRGKIAKALSNGSEVTEVMIKPLIGELINEGFVEKKREPSAKLGNSAKPIPYLVLTSSGEKEIKRLKAAQN
jgi:DNA-binding MarR family transcriptional regulator